MVHYQDKIIIIGGGTGINSQTESKYSYEYNIFTKKFKEIKLRFKRYYHSSVVYKDKLYIYGGFHGTDWNFNIQNLIQISLVDYKHKMVKTTNSPTARGQHSCSLYKNKMIVFGGATEFDFSSEIFEYNFETFDWRKIETENSTNPRRGHGSVVFNDKLFIYGGVVSDDMIFSNPSCFDFQTSKWREIEVDSRSFIIGINASTFLWNDYLIFFGGFYSTERSDVVKFNLKSELIETVSFNQIKGRSWGSGVLVNDTYFYTGGECKMFKILILKMMKTPMKKMKKFFKIFINSIFLFLHLSNIRLIFQTL
jgi:hypothetical protein